LRRAWPLVPWPPSNVLRSLSGGKPALARSPTRTPEPGTRRAAAAHDGPPRPASVECDLAVPAVAWPELWVERMTPDNALRLVLTPVDVGRRRRQGVWRPIEVEAVGQQGATRAASWMAAGTTGRTTAGQYAALLADHHANESMSGDRDVAVFVTLLLAAIERGVGLESSWVNDLVLDDEHITNVRAGASEDPVWQARRRAETIAFQGVRAVRAP